MLYNVIIAIVFGRKALIFNLFLSLITTLMFETVNYIEHYGLERKLLEGTTDVYESVKITHSWNAP